MSEQDIRELQERIDRGILLAQKRLVERAKHDNLKLVVCKNGRVQKLSAMEL
ncbi:MAG: hypothetical protein IKP30_08270 [Bacteroidaceae bacterium]|jgi:hypothetical protein|nr:hypothetical protein [Bacteroidaceae bacterium]